jgi:hypothetical protein
LRILAGTTKSRKDFEEVVRKVKYSLQQQRVLEKEAFESLHKLREQCYKLGLKFANAKILAECNEGVLPIDCLWNVLNDVKDKDFQNLTDVENSALEIVLKHKHEIISTLKTYLSLYDEFFWHWKEMKPTAPLDAVWSAKSDVHMIKMSTLPFFKTFRVPN